LFEPNDLLKREGITKVLHTLKELKSQIEQNTFHRKIEIDSTNNSGDALFDSLTSDTTKIITDDSS